MEVFLSNDTQVTMGFKGATGSSMAWMIGGSIILRHHHIFIIITTIILLSFDKCSTSNHFSPI